MLLVHACTMGTPPPPPEPVKYVGNVLKMKFRNGTINDFISLFFKA